MARRSGQGSSLPPEHLPVLSSASPSPVFLLSPASRRGSPAEGAAPAAIREHHAAGCFNFQRLFKDRLCPLDAKHLHHAPDLCPWAGHPLA